MLIDKITIKAKAGKGGDGVVRWRREKFVPLGGPWGGNGGRGGDVYLRGVRDVYLLKKYDNNKEYSAEDGLAGGAKLQEGAKGKDLIIDVPVGSVIRSREYDTTYRVDNDTENILILRGGKGGYGNDHFKSSTNRTPEESTPGATGEYATLDIEVEMIADVGLIGFPNAGKSTLLNELTRAQAKTANYAFTTLEPNLGDFHGYILADLPGLIEGAHAGKGLGHKFLKHIRRTKILVHLVSIENENLVESYTSIRNELSSFDTTLVDKEEIVVVSKVDAKTSETEKAISEFSKKLGKEVYTISALDDASITAFAHILSHILAENSTK